MESLISNAQSAFIKKRSIHDNCIYVKNLARKFHQTKTPCLLFKLDIKKAFDSVRWDYLMDLLFHCGFLQSFCDWVWALLSTSTSHVLVNHCDDVDLDGIIQPFQAIRTTFPIC
jgi:hypothetical protein